MEVDSKHRSCTRIWCCIWQHSRRYSKCTGRQRQQDQRRTTKVSCLCKKTSCATRFYSSRCGCNGSSGIGCNRPSSSSWYRFRYQNHRRVAKRRQGQWSSQAWCDWCCYRLYSKSNFKSYSWHDSTCACRWCGSQYATNRRRHSSWRWISNSKSTTGTSTICNESSQCWLDTAYRSKSSSVSRSSYVCYGC